MTDPDPDHVHVFAEKGLSGHRLFAYWRECACGEITDYHSRPSVYLIPRRYPRRRVSWPLRLGLLLAAGILACFAWVALFDDHRSDLDCADDPDSYAPHLPNFCTPEDP